MSAASTVSKITRERWQALPNKARAALVRSDLFRALSWSFLYPTGTLRQSLATLLGAINSRSEDLPTHRHACAAIEKLERFNGDSVDLVAYEFSAIFGHTISADCPPYETQYGTGIIFAQTQRMGDITAFYRAFGVQVAPDAHERHDHIATELEFMSVMAFREATAIIENDPEHLAAVLDAGRKFLVEHVAPWGLTFAERLARKARLVAPPEGGFYAALTRCLGAMLRDELPLAQVTLESVGQIEPAKVDFQAEGCSFACGAVGEPILANLPGFDV
jgi:TorA maturation chaperone TorD